MKTTNYKTKKLATLAMMAAISYLAVTLIRIPISSVEFLKFEPKDTIIVIAGFMYGPLASVAISVVVSLIEFVTISSTGIHGMIMNIISTCSFACTAAVIYKYRRNLSGAIIGLTCGVLFMSAMMLLWNWIVTPLYMTMPRDAIKEMLLPVFLPFNMIKGAINAALTMMLYKPIVSALRKLRFLPAESDGQHHGVSLPLIVFSAALIALCAVIVVVLK